MAYELNGKIRDLEPYQPVTGNYRVRLDANESFLTLPKEVREKALRRAFEEEFNRYPDPYASELCRNFGYLYGIDPRLITAGNGSDELISLLAGAFFETGDALLTLQQDFSMYRFYGNVYGVQTPVYPKREDLTIDVEGLISYIRENRIRGLIFSNPCNPTSLCLPREQVLELVRSLPDCLVVVDEAYMDFANDSVLEDVERFENLIVLKTCSKAIGMAALRLGFAVANETLSRALRAVKSPYNVNAVSQAIGSVVLQEGEYLAECIRKILQARDRLYCGLQDVQETCGLFEHIYKSSTNFIFVKSSRAAQIRESLLSRSIAIRQMGGYLRISAGSEEETEYLLRCLRETVGCGKAETV